VKNGIIADGEGEDLAYSAGIVLGGAAGAEIHNVRIVKGGVKV
jgi:hypothetical protein